MKIPLLIACLSIVCAAAADSYFANGIKIGEVDQDSAILWTRLTAVHELNRKGASFLVAEAHAVPASIQIPEGKTLADMEGAVPGAEGAVRFIWREQGGEAHRSPWIQVQADSDYTARYKLTGLKPGTEYSVKVASQSESTFTGRFKTAPTADTISPVTFAVSTCQEYTKRDDRVNGHFIYSLMARQQLDFFVHTGDSEYYDKPSPYATNLDFARFKLARIYGLPNLISFHNSTPAYFIKDDHDTTRDDAWPGIGYGELTWEQGLNLFREHFPVLDKNYRTIRWGKDLQIWLVEGRDFRSPNTMEDGPDKSIWGKEQKEWFFRTVETSDATFKILISPTPVVGPDRGEKNDNHANVGFKHEGDELRRFIAARTNMFVACGDRHWQYVSVDTDTGLKEFSCGPASDVHAGGWSNDRVLPAHRYLNVQGGFMTISVDREEGRPILTARHYDTVGNICNEDINPAE